MHHASLPPKRKAFIPAHTWIKCVWSWERCGGELWGTQKTRVILTVCRNVNRQQLQRRNSFCKKCYWGILCCSISTSYWLFLNLIGVFPALLHYLTLQFLCPIFIIYIRQPLPNSQQGGITFQVFLLINYTLTLLPHNCKYNFTCSGMICSDRRSLSWNIHVWSHLQEPPHLV